MLGEGPSFGWNLVASRTAFSTGTLSRVTRGKYVTLIPRIRGKFARYVAMALSIGSAGSSTSFCGASWLSSRNVLSTHSNRTVGASSDGHSSSHSSTHPLNRRLVRRRPYGSTYSSGTTW